MRSLKYLLILPLILLSIPAYALTQMEQELVYRVSFGRGDDIRLLLKQGTNVNLKNEEGWPLIAIAADRTDPQGLEVMAALLDAGADVNAVDKGKHYPILNATKKNNVEAVRFLIAHGADVNVRDSEGYPLRSIADEAGQEEIVALIDAKIKEDQTALDKLKSPQNLNRLLRQYAHDSCRSQYWAFYLASKQDPEMVESEIMDKRDNAEQDALTSLKEIRRLFVLESNSLTSVGTNSKQAIQTELQNMVSNRNRKSQGVGTDEDAEKRCKRIANLWTVNFTATPR